MLVFDVTNEESFKNLDYWREEIEKYFSLLYRNGSNESQKILIGNKVDLTGKRVVSEERAEQYAKKYGMNYV